ncbi:hypothetical protein Acy02nite_07610 [Actinoplanes cyaneus]|uniref:Lipoprotein n=1 Tax=Actinoplanes cyaneus TaxID=52696 RepID=A0A919IB81_9ACTN|nr:hypothetical protein [Actinoplanes cyaneus]MCW2135757.1 hypothetical protein [Actinoplanes cyaneus]GID62880.1 hypothetical protein Acy02nite_07610 [Actinoplanes cyaneus]
MRTRIVVFAGAAAFALLAGGCGDKPVAAPAAPGAATSATAGAPAEASAGASAVAPGGAPSEAPAGVSTGTPGGAPATSKPATVPVKTAKPAPVGDPGDGGNWFGALKPCPNKEQEVEVQKMATGDLTGDGVADVLVARSCTAITSYWPSTVEIFDGAAGGEKPKRIGTLLGDLGPTDVPAVQSLKVSDRVLTITAYGRSKMAPAACPDLKLTYQYKYSGGQFARTNRNAVTAKDCLPIQ